MSDGKAVVGWGDYFAALFTMTTSKDQEESFGDIETELVSVVNSWLPDNMVCTRDELRDGDIFIREVQNLVDEAAAMGARAN